MTYFAYAKHIFERLKIKNPFRTLIYNFPFFDKEKFNKMFHNKNIKNQNGGARDKSTFVVYKGEKYLFTRVEEDDGYMYYALHQNQNELEQMCIMITVERELNNCDIHTLSYDKNCFAEKTIDKNKEWAGSDLLKISLLLINKIKDKYKIKTITLTDNAQKFCRERKNIDLGLMLTLISGDTWYGKYGFRPKNKILQKEYDKNKKIIKNTRMLDAPYFKSMLEDALKKYYKKNNKMQEEIMETYDEYCKHNKRLKNFLSFLLEYYDITCELFHEFYLELSIKLDIYPLYGKSFIKYL